MANGNGQFGEFLNPKSMLTPGLAGGLTLMITNTLSSWFGAPLAYTALGISAICGLLVLTVGVPLLQRVVFYVLNSLVIFTVAMGSNATGQQIQTARQEQHDQARAAPQSPAPQSQGFFKPWTF